MVYHLYLSVHLSGLHFHLIHQLHFIYLQANQINKCWQCTCLQTGDILKTFMFQRERPVGWIYNFMWWQRCACCLVRLRHETELILAWITWFCPHKHGCPIKKWPVVSGSAASSQVCNSQHESLNIFLSVCVCKSPNNKILTTSLIFFWWLKFRLLNKS